MIVIIRTMTERSVSGTNPGTGVLTIRTRTYSTIFVYAGCESTAGRSNSVVPYTVGDDSGINAHVYKFILYKKKNSVYERISMYNVTCTGRGGREGGIGWRVP